MALPGISNANEFYFAQARGAAAGGSDRRGEHPRFVLQGPAQTWQKLREAEPWPWVVECFNPSDEPAHPLELTIATGWAGQIDAPSLAHGLHRQGVLGGGDALLRAPSVRRVVDCVLRIDDGSK